MRAAFVACVTPDKLLGPVANSLHIKSKEPFPAIVITGVQYFSERTSIRMASPSMAPIMPLKTPLEPYEKRSAIVASASQFSLVYIWVAGGQKLL